MISDVVEQHFHKFVPRVVLISLTLFIFLNPFPQISALKQSLFYIALISALFMLLSPSARPDFSSPVSLPFLLFLLWAFASTIWAFDWKNTLHDAYGYLLKHLILYYILIAFVTKKEHFLALIWSFIISTTLFALGAVIYTYVILANPISFRLDLEYIQTNPIAQCCLFGALLALFYSPIAKKRYEKITLLLCFISTCSALVITYSRASLLSLAIGCLFFTFTSKLKTVFIATTSVVLIVLIASIVMFNLAPVHQKRLTSDSICKDERKLIYITAYEMIKDKPLAGFGYGREAFKKNFYKFLPGNLVVERQHAHPHNVFLDIAARLGLVGLVLFCWTLFYVFKMGKELFSSSDDSFFRPWGCALTACLVAFLTMGSFGDILNTRNSVILYSIMAMITILWKLKRSTEESPLITEKDTKGS